MKYILIILSLFLTQCDVVPEPDPFILVLPSYTEQGMNTVGALFNEKALIKHRDPGIILDNVFDPAIDSVFHSDLTLYHLSLYPDENEDSYFIAFNLDAFELNETMDYLALEGKEVKIDGVQNRCIVSSIDLNDLWECTNGTIYFHRVKKDRDTVVISATFYLENKDLNLKLTHGRFDIKFARGL